MKAGLTQSRRWVDWLGAGASIGCALHCAAMSVIILAWPALWLNPGLRASGLWQLLWWTEAGLLVFAWLLGSTAAWLAWRRERAPAIPLLLLIGLALLTAAILSPFHGTTPWVSAFALLGGVLVALAHALNLRRRPAAHGSTPRRAS